MEKLKFEITIKNSDKSIELDRSDINEIYAISDNIDFNIKSVQSSEDFKSHSRLSIETYIIILAASMPIAGILKTFLESIVKEAGKDFWTRLKKTINVLWNKQNEKVYRNHGAAFLIFPFGPHFVAFKFHKKASEKNIIIDYNSDLDEQIKLVYKQLEKIESDFSALVDDDVIGIENELTMPNFQLNKPKKYVFVVERVVNRMDVQRQDYYTFMKKYGDSNRY